MQELVLLFFFFNEYGVHFSDCRRARTFASRRNKKTVETFVLRCQRFHVQTDLLRDAQLPIHSYIYDYTSDTWLTNAG